MYEIAYLGRWETLPETAAAICGQDTPKLEALLQGGLDLDVPIQLSEYIKLMPLEIAVFQNDVPMIYFLLEHGADPDLAEEQPLLLTAVRCCGPEVVALFAGQAAKLSPKQKERAFQEVRWGQRAPKLEALLQGGLDLDVPIQLSEYIKLMPLEIAVFRNDVPMIHFLLEHGADPGLAEEQPLLLTAARCCGPEVVALFAGQAAKLSPKQKERAFQEVRWGQRAENIQVLEQAGITVDKFGGEAFRAAVSEGNTLFAGQAAKLSPKQKERAFQEVRWGQRAENIQVLEQAGITVDKFGGEAFRAAVSEGNTKLARLLLEKGADINYHKPDMVFPYASTPVTEAARSNNFSMVRWLVEQGADITIVDKYGDRPYSVAVQNKNQEMADYLKALEPEEWHNEQEKIRQLMPYKLPAKLVEYLKTGPLRLDFPEQELVKWAELYSYMDVQEMTWKRKKLLSLMEDRPPTAGVPGSGMGEVGGALLLHGCAGDDLETEKAALPDGADGQLQRLSAAVEPQGQKAVVSGHLA